MRLNRLLATLAVCLTACPMLASADWVADADDPRQLAAARAIADIRERVPRSVDYFDNAYGFAILPSVTRIGFGFGGAFGKGLVVEGEHLIGTTTYWQFTSGIQAGARIFSMVILFRDKAALDEYASGKTQFTGQAGLAIANRGIAGTPAYDDGVAIFVVTRLALMGEFTVSGAKFGFRPLKDRIPDR
jgi:lipid-binding SYLF domain-containing protein